ncbi:YraN family protein [Candidatus Saccharibacteria bacterium]|nr:YraN family protein [Candidatus Saccharibacteria bacterium]
MARVSTGLTAETAVAEFLKQSGYEILDRNWKTKVCEIDIVACRSRTVFFIEVKYRSSLRQGGGFEYILARKLKQMEFAAKIWNQRHGWDGDWRLVAAAVSGPDHQSVDLIEIF